MKKLSCLLFVVGLGFASLAVATEAPALETEESAAPKITDQQMTPVTIEPLEDLLKTEAAQSCIPSCFSLDGEWCNPGNTCICYHNCFEPGYCTCPDGTWNCN